MKVDRELGAAPGHAPTTNQAVKVVVVDIPLSRIGIALVPDSAPNGIGNHGVEAPIVEPAGIAVAIHVAGQFGLDDLGRDTLLDA